MGMTAYQLKDGRQEEVRLKAHLVFDTSNGKILHRHWQPVDDKSVIAKDRIFKLVRNDLKVDTMGILIVDGSQMHPTKKYSVDLENLALREN